MRRCRMVRFMFCVVVAGSFFLSDGSAHAGLLVAPSTSDVVNSTLTDDSSWGPLDLGFSFPFFGSNVGTNLFMGSNGYLSTKNTTIYDSHLGFPLSSPIPMIAPFFGDLNPPGGGDLRYNNSNPGEFVAIWNGIQHTGDSGSSVTAEAVLLGAGNSFGAADGTIVFSYGTVSGGPVNSPAVGLNQGDGIGFATLSGNGTMTYLEAAGLSNRTFTFTPNGSGGYTEAEGAPTISGPSPAPEPSTAVLLGVAAACGGFGFYRKRRGVAS